LVPALGPLSVRFQPFSVPAQTVSDGWTDRSFTETCPDDEDALIPPFAAPRPNREVRPKAAVRCM